MKCITLKLSEILILLIPSFKYHCSHSPKLAILKFPLIRFEVMLHLLKLLEWSLIYRLIQPILIYKFTSTIKWVRFPLPLINDASYRIYKCSIAFPYTIPPFTIINTFILINLPPSPIYSLIIYSTLWVGFCKFPRLRRFSIRPAWFSWEGKTMIRWSVLLINLKGDFEFIITFQMLSQLIILFHNSCYLLF